MSAYGEFTTVMREQTHLIAALVALGFTESQIEIHEGKGAALMGHHGDARSERAQVIIRRGHVGMASNDIGFALTPDGTYRAIISEYDREAEGAHASETGGYNDKWLGRLAQAYTESRVMAVGLTRGYLFRGREIEETPTGPKITLRFAER